MEEHQRDHIQENLPDLVFFTDCNVTFTNILVSKKVLSEDDKESLNIIEHRYKKATKLYEIILERANSYYIVRDALKETCQTGAEDIFNQLESDGPPPAIASTSKAALSALKSRTRKRIRYEVRSPVHLFTGREPEILQLHEHLTSQQNGDGTTTTIITQAASVTGLGGIGKTELCRKYVEIYSEFYDGNVIWITAEHEAEMVRSFRILAKDHLKISLKDFDGQEKDIQTVVDEVYNYFLQKKALFVFDNAMSSDDEKLDIFLPIRVTTKPAVLITSRDRDWRELPSKILVLGELKEDEAMAFVKKGLELTDSSQDDDIKTLVKRLQYFPLAIQQAVSYIKCSVSSTQVKKYLGEYETQAKKLLDQKAKRRATNHYAMSTLTTWSVTTDSILKEEKLGKLSIHCLNIMAYLQPDDIRVSLFLKCDEISKKYSSCDVEVALQLLVKYSMVRSHPSRTNLSMHRLVQEVTRIHLQENGEESQVLRNCLSIFIRPEMTERNIEHATSVMDYCDKSPSLLREFIKVPSILGRALVEERMQECSEFCTKWHSNLTSLLPKGHVEIIHMELALALTLRNEKKYEEALEALYLVLAKYMSIQGPNQDDWDIWNTYIFIAECLMYLARFEESLELAKTVFQEQLTISKVCKRLLPVTSFVFSLHLKMRNFKGASEWCENMVECFHPNQSTPSTSEQGNLMSESCYLKEIGRRVKKLMRLNKLWSRFADILTDLLIDMDVNTCFFSALCDILEDLQVEKDCIVVICRLRFILHKSGLPEFKTLSKHFQNITANCQKYGVAKKLLNSTRLPEEQLQSVIDSGNSLKQMQNLLKELEGAIPQLTEIMESSGEAGFEVLPEFLKKLLVNETFAESFLSSVEAVQFTENQDLGILLSADLSEWFARLMPLLE